ncbi:MAG: hypothetical protein HGA90_03100 [Alphaproteobacteria bacterium]|nr:hypothetical protein [Alphaproteobacteria bacterium]
MTDKILYWASVLFSLIALLLLVTNAALISGNRGLQDELNRRQASIATASNLMPLNQNLAQGLAEAAIKNNDAAIRDLLSAQGITINKSEKGAKDKAAVNNKKSVEE